ncbi:rho guanine nucleotide exchange factor 40-like, partial [Seriola lalandi dorsalis]|uniref:rho guanine nucleotide exchange factor 40-like n=1 Tax=Seriola lalandi dorsalis TaxID=1841481 RepID=UPI000C6F7866
MDSESLDRCIQTALSALYPPFQATSPTVLFQVLNVVETRYRGDGLRYLLHFLLPAKQLLHRLQQHASVQCGEGWPLCVQEKVVVQLCPLDQRFLRPGDFYLLVSPAAPPPPLQPHGTSCRSCIASSSPRLLLCSVSAGSRYVEQQEVSELALLSLFSMAWLDSVNREREQRGASRLERCVLSANGDIFRVPWEDLVYPQFISRPLTALKDDTPRDLCRDINSRQEELRPSAPKTDQSAASSEADDSEGEYVELTELPLPRFSPQKGSLTQSISLQHRARTSTRSSTHTAAGHTPHNINTHTTHTAAANTPHNINSHTAASHTPHNINTHTAEAHTPHNINTHSSLPRVDISPHTEFCSKLIGENLHQGSCGPVILTPISPNTPTCSSCSSSAPAEVVGTSISQSEHQVSQEQTEGTDSDGQVKLNTEPDDNREQRVEEEEEEEKEKEGETEEKRQEGELLERHERKNEMVSVEEGVEKEEEEVQEEVGQLECRREENLLPHTYTAKEGGEREEEDESEETDGNGEEELDEEGDDELEEVEVEEEVQVVIVQQSQERREEEQVMKEDEGEEGTEKDQEEREGLSDDDPPPPQSEVSPSTGPSPTEPEQPAPPPQLDHPAVPTAPVQSSRSSRSSFFSVLLSSGAVCLPGTRDKSGRALLTVCTWSSVWSNPGCERAELLRLLLYYTSTLRKEMRALGLTVLVDARRAVPVPALFSALRSLQENTPGSVHTVLLLVKKDSSLRLDKPAASQVEVLNSLKSVQKHVELQQLPAELGGSFSFRQSSWLSFRARVEQLTSQCEDVIRLLQKTISVLQTTPLPAAAEDAELLLSRYKAVMCSVLEDSRLVQLQQEGGACLSWLRREESSISVTEEYRAQVEAVSSLYEQVDELLHRLVTLSNSRTQELTFILDFRILEQGFTEVRLWLEEVGEVQLKTLDEPEDSLELLNRKQQKFKDFYTTAYDHCKRGEALLARLERWVDVSSADLHSYEVKVHSFWAQLQDFSQRVNTTGQNIDRAVRLYRFLDQAYGWALEGMRHLAGVSMEECTLPDKCQAVIGCLEDYQREHPPITDARFQEMKAAAGELRGERGLRQWSFAWSKCQETKKMFDRKMEAALRTRDSSHRRRSDSTHSRSSISSRKTLSGLWGVRETSSSSWPPEEDANTSSPSRSASSLLPLTSSPIAFTPAPSSGSSHTPQHTPLLQRLFRSVSSEESSDRVDLCSSPSLPRLDSSSCSSSSFSFSSSRRQQLRKTQSFDCPSTPEAVRYGSCARALSEPVRRGNTGVFIRGLEVSSTEAADHTLCPRTPAHGWMGQGLRTPGTPGTPRTIGSPAIDPRPRGRWVISWTADLHHDLVVVLNRCSIDPHVDPDVVSLSQQEQFSLYALYSKNKPKSDALLLNHGNSFFRRKQVELGDKMDLSSYLLKPVQRMSKYALLLTDLSKEVGVAQEAELVALQAATDMVKFQLRHGNDLLAMDAIRDCDVNLKEQGQLIRQDEFTVWTGRRKCQRHIFLFEELILFSKPKKMEGGLDVFIYKHSFK